MSPLFIINFVVFLPAVAAIALAFFPSGNKNAIRWVGLLVTAVVFLATVWMAFPGEQEGQFNAAAAEMQDVVAVPWIPSFDIHYFMGLDGISFPLVVLTSLISLLACGASWSIEKNVKAYFILFLLLETGMLGVFMALDFFLFYVFWEVMLLPMYFLIGVWGGPRKEYAAIKFFLYTLFGSVLMLIAILMLYFNSDLTLLNTQQLADARVLDAYYARVDAEASDNPRMAAPKPPSLEDEEDSSADEAHPGGEDATTEHTGGEPAAASSNTLSDAKRNEIARGHLDSDIKDKKRSKHTFNILALQKMGQLKNSPFTEEVIWGLSLQYWAFWLLFIGFIIKVPSVPLHTWLPDAHVEAPTPISMILAGVLLKMGGYGIIRICYPICPLAGYECAFWICLIGVVSMVYGAFAAMAQKDFKRLVAYSSVSHMGYVVLGLGVWSMGTWSSGDTFDPQYWNMGVKGAMFQMIAHGISSAGMFFMVGVIYDRVHHRNLNEFGGLFGKMPGYTAMAIGLFFAGLGLPGLCGFIGEVLVVLSVWKFNIALAVISAAVVILTAGYILWAIQRVYLGPEYKGPHPEALVPMKVREWLVAVPLFVLAIFLGVFPATLLGYMDTTINAQTKELTAWTREVGDVDTALAQTKPTDTNETMLAESP